MKNPKIVITDNRLEYRYKKNNFNWMEYIEREIEKITWTNYED